MDEPELPSSPKNLPTQRSTGGRSGQMAVEALSKDVAFAGTDPDVLGPENTWTEQPEEISGNARLFLKGLIAVVLIAGGAGAYFFIKSSLDQPMVAPLPELQDIKDIQSPLIAPALPISPLVETRSKEETDQMVVDLLTRYNQIDSVAGLLPLAVPIPGLEEKMKRFYQKFPEQLQPRPIEIQDVQTTTLDGVLMFAVSSLVGEKRSPRSYTVIPIGDQLFVEWESSNAYSEVSLEELRASKSEEPALMRLFLGRAVRLPHANQPGVIRTQSRIGEEFLTAYAAPEGSIYRDIQSLRLGDMFPFVAKVRWNTAQRLPEVTELIHRYWLDTKEIAKIVDDYQKSLSEQVPPVRNSLSQ